MTPIFNPITPEAGQRENCELWTSLLYIASSRPIWSTWFQASPGIRDSKTTESSKTAPSKIKEPVNVLCQGPTDQGSPSLSTSIQVQLLSKQPTASLRYKHKASWSQCLVWTGSYDDSLWGHPKDAPDMGKYGPHDVLLSPAIFLWPFTSTNQV